MVCPLLVVIAFVSIALNVLQGKRRRKVPSQSDNMSPPSHHSRNSSDGTDYADVHVGTGYENVGRGGQHHIESQTLGYQALSMRERASSSLYTSLRKDRP